MQFSTKHFLTKEGRKIILVRKVSNDVISDMFSVFSSNNYASVNVKGDGRISLQTDIMHLSFLYLMKLKFDQVFVASQCRITCEEDETITKQMK